jgi:hypothetical protein
MIKITNCGKDMDILEKDITSQYLGMELID